MLFHKKDIMKTIFILLLSVRIITSNNRSYIYHLPVPSNTVGNEDQESDASDASNTPGDENNEDLAAPTNSTISADDPVTISDGVTEEVFLEYPACWESMKAFCEVEIPHAGDFAKAVIRQWKKVDVFIYNYPDGYYNEFETYLDADKILPPDEFCAKLVSGALYADGNEDQEAEAPDTDTRANEVDDALSCFGGTNEAALKHCFYEIIKREPLGVLWEREREFTIITANNRSNFSDIKDASNNPDEDAEDASEFDPVTISDGVTEEVFLEYPACWESLKIFCNVEIPHAVDFAKAVIRQWKVVDVFVYHYPDEYYNLFEQYLDADKILPPDEFCAKLVSGALNDDNENQEAEASDTELTPVNEDDEIECKNALSCFGGTNETALKHCFYEIIKREPLPVLWEREREYNEPDPNSLTRSMEQLSFSNDKYYTHQFMIHMSKKVDVKPGIISPLRFCKEWEVMERSD